MTRRTIRWPGPGQTDANRLVVDAQRPLYAGSRGDWVVLPTTPDAEEWAIVAGDREGIRQAREVFTAFVGPHVATLPLTPNAVRVEYPEGSQDDALALIVNIDRSGEFQDGLQRMVTVRTSGPIGMHCGVKSISELIRDLRLALFDGAGTSAEALFQQLREEGRLSAENLDFLEIELLARLGRWRELRRLPWFLQVVRSPRPVVTTEFLLEAIWWSDFVDDGFESPEQALKKYQELPTQLHRLFDAIDVPASTPGKRIAAIRSLEQGSSDRLERIGQAAGDREDWFRRLLPPKDPTLELSTADRARQLFSDGRFRDVVELGIAFPDEAAALESAVRAVAEVESAELAASLRPLLSRDRVAALPTTPGFLRCLDRVETLSSDNCSGWAEWFDRVALPEAWTAAAEVLRRDATEWSLEEVADSKAAARAAVALETALGGENDRRLDEVSDLLCEAAAQLASAPGAARLVDAVLFSLLERSPTETLGSAFLSLVQAVLRAGPTVQRYRDLLDVCLTSPQLFSARVLIPVALDLLDEIALHGSPDPNKRRAIAVLAYDAFVAHASRGHLTVDEARLAELLIDELGLEGATVHVAIADTEDGTLADPWMALSDRTIVLYTLLEGLGARFADRVRSFCPSADVVTMSDHVSTDRLRLAARDADFVMVDTRHAKHAATEAIDGVRPRSQQLLPDGKGVSSFIRCLAAALRDLVPRA